MMLPDARPVPFIARTRGSGYLGRTMLRLFACLFAAMALFFSPIVMAGGGMAAAHVPTTASAMPDGHCSGSEAPADDPQRDISEGCAGSCAAFEPAFPRIPEEAAAKRAAPPLPTHQLLVGIHPEGETPPPRITPEI